MNDRFPLSLQSVVATPASNRSDAPHDEDLLGQLPLTDIVRVTFYKRDEITTDLICCEIVTADKTWTFHEEAAGWGLLIRHLQRLPGFRDDWFGAVSQPPFEVSRTVAYSRR